MLSRCMSSVAVAWVARRGRRWRSQASPDARHCRPSTAPPVIAPSSEVAAAREAVFDLLPAFEMPEPTTVPAPSAAPTTPASRAATAAAELAPATHDRRSRPTSVVGDPRGAEALALIAFPWRRTLPGWSIAFLPARAGLRGLTRVDERRIEIYVRDGDSAASLARVVAHELGHAVDVELNSPSDRERWRAVRGVGPVGELVARQRSVRLRHARRRLRRSLRHDVDGFGQPVAGGATARPRGAGGLGRARGR